MLHTDSVFSTTASMDTTAKEMRCVFRFCVRRNGLIHTLTRDITNSPTRCIRTVGGWKNAQTVRRGYELNYKLIAMQLDQHQGSLPAQYSFLQVEPDNVLVTALKKVEDGNALIARYFEWAGKKTEVKLAFPG